MSFQYQVELLEETGAKLLAVTHGLLKLRVGCGRRGAIPVGIRFSYQLQLLCVVPVSFGVGLRISGLLSCGLRVEILLVRFIALANCVSGRGFGVESAPRFLVCAIFRRGFAV
jgi:hypothetical protein